MLSKAGKYKSMTSLYKKVIIFILLLGKKKGETLYLYQKVAKRDTKKWCVVDPCFL